MTILNVVEYKEEGVAIVEDTLGKYAVTETFPGPIPLEALHYQVISRHERDRLLT